MAVRRESVLLTLDDQFSTGMAKAAAATALLNRSLHDLDGTGVSASRSVAAVGDESDRTSLSVRRSGESINQLTGRLRLLTDVALTLGPALVPLGAGGVAGIVGMTAQFGALAGGIGVSIAALNGVGDALEAVNKYELEPTGDNLAKVAEEFNKLGPAGADFVVFLESISPQLREMQMLAREGFLPGLADGIESFLSRGEQLNNIVGDLAEALGDLSSSAGEALGGESFDAFFEYLDRTAGPLLLEFGRSIGNVAEGLANMMVAFSPVSSEFSSGLEDMTRRFAEWSAGLESNDSFQEFLSYIRTNGPAAVDFLGSFVEALASVVEAAAPIGQAVLPVLTSLLDVFAAIAGTGIGSTALAAAAGFVAFNRAASVLGPAVSKVGTALFLTDKAFTDAGRAAEASRASMLRAAATAGVVMVAFEGLTAIGERIGDLQRHFDTAGASMENFAEVQAALEGSALGQYAADLGIDMQRLTEDFAANGREGEYVAQVLTQLGEEGGSNLRLLFDAGAPANEMLSTLGITFGKNAEEANKAGVALQSLLEQYEPTGQAARETAQAQEALNEDLNYTTTSLDSLQNALKSAREMWKENRKEARSVAESFVNLGDSLNDNKVSLNGWLKQLEDNARALQEFQRNAREAGRRGLDEGLVESLRNAGSEGALRMRQLANATDEQIERANKSWYKGQGAVKDFVKEVGGVKPKYITRLEAEIEEAMAEISRLKAALNIPDETVNVWVTRRTVGGSPGMGPVPAGADGMTVPGQRAPYGDKVLAFIAPGEEVISNRFGQADKHRDLLKAINANRYADGGTAGGSRGIGPMNPLYGINRNFISAQEMAERMMNLTMRQIAGFGDDIMNLGKGPLAKLGLAFEKFTDMRERELDRDLRHAERRTELQRKEQELQREQLEARRDELQALRDSMTAYAEQVSSNFNSDIFRSGQFDDLRFNDRIQATGNAALEQLRADTRGAGSFQYLLGQLTDLGFDGAGYEQLAASGNSDMARYLIGLGAGGIDSFEQDFADRQAQLDSLGQLAGTQVFGGAIDAASVAANEQLAVLREQRDLARRAEAKAERIERRLERFSNQMDKIEQAAGEKGPKAFAAAVAGAVSAGQRSAPGGNNGGGGRRR